MSVLVSRGATVGFCFKDSTNLARKERIGFVISIADEVATIFPLWISGDAIAGGAPPNVVANVPLSAKLYSDDPARITAGTTCWYKP